MKTVSKSRNESNVANIGFEQKLWLAADKLRSKIVARKIVKVIDKPMDRELMEVGY